MINNMLTFSSSLMRSTLTEVSGGGGELKDQPLLNHLPFLRKYFADRKKGCFFASAFLKFFKRSIRLVVRTSGFHPGNRGSIPLWTTLNDLIFFITA